jgi:ERCC4-type nuclease
MNKFYFTIDIRESKLLDYFGVKNGKKWSVKPKYETYVKFDQLPVGDIIYYDNAVSPPTPVVMIERKEIKDLSSCIYSGSYKEQKLRMLKFRTKHPAVQLVYLIENFTISQKSDLIKIANRGAPPKQRKTMKVLLSSIVSTMLRDNFFVMTTQGFEGTVAFIERVFEKWPSYKSELSKRQTNVNHEYLKNLKVTKKENITPENWFKMCLAQIQGVSIEKASCINKNYPTFKKLLSAYESLENETDREKMLKDVQCGSRKLGPVCSKRIYEYLFAKIPKKTKKIEEKKN